MTAPTQQARAAILAEACHAASVLREYSQLTDWANRPLLNKYAKEVMAEQVLRLAKAEEALAKLEGEAP